MKSKRELEKSILLTLLPECQIGDENRQRLSRIVVTCDTLVHNPLRDLPDVLQAVSDVAHDTWEDDWATLDQIEAWLDLIYQEHLALRGT